MKKLFLFLLSALIAAAMLTPRRAGLYSAGKHRDSCQVGPAL